jgi:hypothetical protein
LRKRVKTEPLAYALPSIEAGPAAPHAGVVNSGPKDAVQWLSDLDAHLEKVPADQRVDALMDSLSSILEVMELEEVIEVRDLLSERFGAEDPLIELVDGNLALRDIAAMTDES